MIFQSGGSERNGGWEQLPGKEHPKTMQPQGHAGVTEEAGSQHQTECGYLSLNSGHHD